MGIEIFPDVLKNIKINDCSLYSSNPSILYFSLNELENYIESHSFSNLISATSSCPTIYLEDALDLNQTFNKISPKSADLSEEEKLYIFNKIASPSTIVWTVYQYLISMIHNAVNSSDKKELAKKKTILESSLLKTKKNITLEKFNRFIYGSSRLRIN